MLTVYHGDIVAAVINPPINPGLGFNEKGSIRLTGPLAIPVGSLSGLAVHHSDPAVCHTAL